MDADAGAFQVFYASFVHHPLLLWLAAALGTTLALCRPGVDPSIRRYSALLGFLSVLDAWLTADGAVGLGSLSGWTASAVPLFFVLAGDYRYLLVAVCGTRAGGLALKARGLLAASGLVLIVPLTSRGLVSLLPDALDSPRMLYLVYELGFALLTLTLASRHPNVRDSPWLRRVSHFVVLYYGLWAAADAILLVTGSDLGYALRVVPNLLYYGGLIPAIAWLAPLKNAGTSNA